MVLFNGPFGIIGAIEDTETPNGATALIELPDLVWEKFSRFLVVKSENM
jgi:hypothetical protein